MVISWQQPNSKYPQRGTLSRNQGIHEQNSQKNKLKVFWVWQKASFTQF
jgi:hypothetical protein